jgi:cell division protein FtsB
MALEQDLKNKSESSSPKERKGLKRLLFYLSALFLLLGLTGLLNYKKLIELYNLYQLKTQLTQELENVKKENVRLSQEIIKLQGDNAYLEEQVRKDLNMVKPGETVYQRTPKEPSPKAGTKAGGGKKTN